MKITEEMARQLDAILSSASDKQRVVTLPNMVSKDMCIVLGDILKEYDFGKLLGGNIFMVFPKGLIFIQNDSFLSLSGFRKLNPETYQILGINHNDVVENWYILIKNISIEENELKVFVKNFRDDYCKKPSNINLIDNDKIYPLITKYPLVGDEYITVADHFVGYAIFDIDDVWIYPYQDIKYKEYGGYNWKKKPIN
jgi:hypothetical protein